jgi:hypothetical protein
MNFENTCIQYLSQLQTNGTILEGSLVGVNEVTQVSKAKVSVLINGIADEKFIIIHKVNNELTWNYLNVKDRIDSGFEPVENGWVYPNYEKRIVAPIELIMDDIGIKMYGWFQINELPVHRASDTHVHLYCNVILPEHQAVVDSLGGVITIDDKPTQ